MIFGVDGLIGTEARGNAAFVPATAVDHGVALRCAGGAAARDGCLPDVQIAALRTSTTPARFNFTLASGETRDTGLHGYGSDPGIATHASRPTPTIVFLGPGASCASTRGPATATPRHAFNAVRRSLTALEPWSQRAVAPSGLVVTDTMGVPRPVPTAVRLSEDGRYPRAPATSTPRRRSPA